MADRDYSDAEAAEELRHLSAAKADAEARLTECKRALGAEQSALDELGKDQRAREDLAYLEAATNAYIAGMEAWKLSIIAHEGDVRAYDAAIAELHRNHPSLFDADGSGTDRASGEGPFWLDLFKLAYPGEPRPGDFPPELPFIANVPAKYGRSPNRIECQWHIADEPEEGPEPPLDDRVSSGRFAYLRRRTASLTSATGPLASNWSYAEAEELITSAIDSVAGEVANAAIDLGWVEKWDDVPDARMRAFRSFRREGWTMQVWSLINKLAGGVQVTAEFGGAGY